MIFLNNLTRLWLKLVEIFQEVFFEERYFVMRVVYGLHCMGRWSK